MARPRGLVLVISLLANVFLAGAVGGGMVMVFRQHEGWHQAASPPRPIRVAGAGLPAAERERFQRTMLQLLQGNQQLLRIARENRTVAAELFVQPDFDRGAVTAALDRARNADLQLRIRLETAAIDFAANLPADERQILARGLERGGPLRHPGALRKPANGAR